MTGIGGREILLKVLSDADLMSFCSPTANKCNNVILKITVKIKCPAKITRL
jgi:hypothetical protein